MEKICNPMYIPVVLGTNITLNPEAGAKAAPAPSSGIKRQTDIETLEFGLGFVSGINSNEMYYKIIIFLLIGNMLITKLLKS